MKFNQVWQARAIRPDGPSEWFHAVVPGNVQHDYGVFMGWGGSGDAWYALPQIDTQSVLGGSTYLSEVISCVITMIGYQDDKVVPVCGQIIPSLNATVECGGETGEAAFCFRAFEDGGEGEVVGFFNEAGEAARIRRVAARLFGEENSVEKPEPSMGGEDFSFFGDCAPDAFFHIGCTPAGKLPAPALHSKDFYLDEECLTIGTLMHVALVFDR